MGFDDQASKQVSPLQKAQRSSWEYMQRLYVRMPLSSPGDRPDAQISAKRNTHRNYRS